MQTNHVKKARIHRLSVWVGVMAVMAALYAWAAPDPTLNTPPPAVGWNSANPMDAAIQNLLGQKATNIQNQHNDAIKGDMFDITTLSPAQILTTRHLSAYCASPSESGNCPSDASLMLGDIKASSLFKSSTYDASSLTTAQDYVATLLTPLDNSAVTSFQTYAGSINANTLAGNSALQTQYAQALSDEAALSIIRQAFAEIMAVRTPPTGSQGAQPAPSEMGLMEQMVLQRWQNSTWTNNLGNLSPQQLQQEMALMQAFQNYMSVKLYEQGERQMVVNALLALQNYRTQKNANALINKANTAPVMSPMPTDTSGNSQ